MSRKEAKNAPIPQPSSHCDEHTHPTPPLIFEKPYTNLQRGEKPRFSHLGRNRGSLDALIRRGAVNWEESDSILHPNNSKTFLQKVYGTGTSSSFNSTKKSISASSQDPETLKRLLQKIGSNCDHKITDEEQDQAYVQLVK